MGFDGFVTIGATVFLLFEVDAGLTETSILDLSVLELEVPPFYSFENDYPPTSSELGSFLFLVYLEEALDFVGLF